MSEELIANANGTKDPNVMEALKQIKEQHENEQPIMEMIGEFKLKDKGSRRGLRLDLTKSKRPVTDLISVGIDKIHGQNNRVRVFLEWKPDVKA